MDKNSFIKGFLAGKSLRSDGPALTQSVGSTGSAADYDKASFLSGLAAGLCSAGEIRRAPDPQVYEFVSLAHAIIDIYAKTRLSGLNVPLTMGARQLLTLCAQYDINSYEEYLSAGYTDRDYVMMFARDANTLQMIANGQTLAALDYTPENLELYDNNFVFTETAGSRINEKGHYKYEAVIKDGYVGLYSGALPSVKARSLMLRPGRYKMSITKLITSLRGFIDIGLYGKNRYGDGDEDWFIRFSGVGEYEFEVLSTDYTSFDLDLRFDRDPGKYGGWAGAGYAIGFEIEYSLQCVEPYDFGEMASLSQFSRYADQHIRGSGLAADYYTVPNTLISDVAYSEGKRITLGGDILGLTVLDFEGQLLYGRDSMRISQYPMLSAEILVTMEGSRNHDDGRYSCSLTCIGQTNGPQVSKTTYDVDGNYTTTYVPATYFAAALFELSSFLSNQSKRDYISTGFDSGEVYSVDSTSNITDFYCLRRIGPADTGGT